MNFYVYYKLDAGQVELVRPKVEAFFATVERRFGVRGRWMRRRDDPATYMEVYEGIGDGPAFEALLASEAQALGVPRKAECFISAETPA